MHMLVTGAAGFLGQSVVQQALDRRHHVRALIRVHHDQRSVPFPPHPRLEIIRRDLRHPDALDDALFGIDTVIHLAARMTGPLQHQHADTVEGTRHLLNAMQNADVPHLVLASTFSVYDYQRLQPWSVLDENAPRQTKAAAGNVYAQTKLAQEQLVRDHAEKTNQRPTILRLGVVYGAGHLANAWLGVTRSRWWLRIGNRAPIPLTYVENAAQAHCLAAEQPAEQTRILNVVDDNPPSQLTYYRSIQLIVTPPPIVIYLPTPIMRLAATIAHSINHHLLHDRLDLPDILIPARLAPRTKPLYYDNTRLKETLAWTPCYNLPHALDQLAHRNTMPSNDHHQEPAHSTAR